MKELDDVLDSELSARVPGQVKKKLREIAASRHLEISDILREAIREKIQREFVLEAEVSSVGDDPKERASITLDPDLFEKGRERARKARRNFSNYIEVLIEADVAQPRIPVVHSESVIPVPAMNNKGNPIPIRFDEAEDKLIRKVNAQTGLSMSEIIRRSVRLAGPKFDNGEVNILDITPEAGAEV